MRINIVGAGFFGLALAYHLTTKTKKEHLITVISSPDLTPASQVAAGLLHPFSGREAKESRFAKEGMKETLAILKELDLVEKTGLLRFALTKEKQSLFEKQLGKKNDLRLATQLEKLHVSPSLENNFALFVEEAYVVDTGAYLSRLKDFLLESGASFEERSLSSLDEVRCDLLLLAPGGHFSLLPKSSTLPLRVHKGQLLEIAHPKELSLKTPVTADCYLLKDPRTPRCILGATYEKTFVSIESDCKQALKDLIPRYHALFPESAAPDVLSCKAGLRVSSKSHLPTMIKIDTNCYLCSGLGSKGLLYHSFFALSFLKELGVIL